MSPGGFYHAPGVEKCSYKTGTNKGPGINVGVGIRAFLHWLNTTKQAAYLLRVPVFLSVSEGQSQPLPNRLHKWDNTDDAPEAAFKTCLPIWVSVLNYLPFVILRIWPLSTIFYPIINSYAKEAFGCPLCGRCSTRYQEYKSDRKWERALQGEGFCLSEAESLISEKLIKMKTVTHSLTLNCVPEDMQGCPWCHCSVVTSTGTRSAYSQCLHLLLSE